MFRDYPAFGNRVGPPLDIAKLVSELYHPGMDVAIIARKSAPAPLMKWRVLGAGSDLIERVDDHASVGPMNSRVYLATGLIPAGGGT